jgi:hypothetical protein
MPTTAALVVVDEFVLTPTDISNKYVTLTRTPALSSEVAMNIIHGISQEFGVDFVCVGRQLSWSSYVLDGLLESGDSIRAVYDTENSLNSFVTSPNRDDSYVTSYVNQEVLMTMIQSDGYFTDISKVSRVDITYIHEENRERKTIIHVGSNLTGHVVWSSHARAGTWLKTGLRVRDTDGAIIKVGRDLIGNHQDLILS